MTIQASVFRILRDCGSFTANELAVRTGYTRESCRKATAYLRAKGIAGKHTVRPRIVIYCAIPGKRAPKDRRGKPASCRNHRGATAYAKWIVMMSGKHGRSWRPPMRGATELEQAWPMRVIA